MQYDSGYPVTIVNGMPVVAVTGEIDVSTVGRLRLALLHTAILGHTTIVVDMTCTEFCDSTGIMILHKAHNRALSEGGELRLVIPTDCAVARTLTLTGLDLVIPRFTTLDKALLARLATVYRLPKPRRPPVLPRLPRQPSSPDAGG
jgi:anti-sigma B factor antagonist